MITLHKLVTVTHSFISLSLICLLAVVLTLIISLTVAVYFVTFSMAWAAYRSISVVALNTQHFLGR